MNKTIEPYRVVEFPPERRDMLAANALNSRKHFMYGLLEVDVTIARKFIAEYKTRTGELLSFTAYLAFCLARAVDENKAVQVYRKGRKHLVMFDDVDVGLMIERKIGDRHTAMGYVVRGANHKTFQQIHQEIRSAQSAPIPPSKGIVAWFRSAMALPWPLPGFFLALVRMTMSGDPAKFVSMLGTVGITSVGMFGKGQGGWGISYSAHPLGLIVGGTAWKPAIVEGRIEPREMLSLTAAFDHDVIDGAPAARFTRRLVELIESGYGLDGEIAAGAVETEAAATPTA